VCEIRCAAAVLGLAIAASASAQTAADGATAASEPGRLERVQRLAANPLKAIVEASRIQRRTGSAPVGTDAATAAAGRPVVTILRLPADLESTAGLGPPLPYLMPLPGPTAPVALDLLQFLPWPDELPVQAEALSQPPEGAATGAAQRVAQTAEPGR
jgi:hypothetical protein